MKLLMAVILTLGLMAMVAGQLPKNEDRMCVHQMLSQGDALFCKGNLNVIYPEIGDVGCMYVPECNDFRQKISSWSQPSIKYSQAHEGDSLKTGNISGSELTGYQPPGPPPQTGFHRYQFILFEQPERGKPITLSTKEKAKRGSWSISDFIKHFHLGSPVATNQFLTQNYHDF
ncbi:phosphatidylethanolamine-binding protein 4 isoform X4 [Petaurus breviceps papuanus]|uniref:phosphatidylethanolamine-binding protein 4 isoform X4 n=1 Tax=Petaurus breviceps papuanus TaxID=3040969 RepID=UPI0036DCAF75